MNFSLNASVWVERVDDAHNPCSRAVEFTSFECTGSNDSAHIWIMSESKESSLLQPFASGDCSLLSREMTLCFRDDLKGTSLVATENTAKRSL